MCNAVHILQHLQRVHQTAAGAARQIDLGHIAGNDHLGAYAHTGKKHFHLLRGGVLRFVQNDKGIIQCAPAHISQRGDLDDLLFHQTLVGFCAQHIKQAIIQRPQIGVYLLLQVTGQKAQLLTRFHRRAGQNNAGDLFSLEGLYRHGNGQIGLAGTRRADTEGNGIGTDGAQVFLLSQRFGTDRASLDRDSNKILGQLLYPLLRAIVRQTDAVVHSLILQRGAVLDQKKHSLHGSVRSGHVGRLAGNAQLCTAADSGD